MQVPVGVLVHKPDGSVGKEILKVFLMFDFCVCLLSDFIQS